VRSASFERMAGAAAIVVGLGGLVYAVAFVTILNDAGKGAAVASSLLLLVGGILATGVLIAVYARVRETDPAFALWALVLGLAGGIGSAVHGGYDLALLAKKPAGSAALGANPADPRGLATFGFTALALLIVAWLIRRGGAFDRRLGSLGFVASGLLVIVYLGRLIVLNPKSPGLLVAAVISGFVVNPAFYVWLGVELRRAAGPGP
jgi:hypothetical protein